MHSNVEMSVIENAETIAVARPVQANVVLLGNCFTPTSHSALILLNQRITVPHAAFINLWGAYDIRLCADGGANWLFHFFDEEERGKYKPDYIIGDLDSLKPEVAQWYKEHGVKVIKQSTQYATDLQKCFQMVEIYFDAVDKGVSLDLASVSDYDGLRILHEHITTHTQTQVMLIGAIDGRFDHTIQTISILLKRLKSNPATAIFCLTATDLIFALPRGTSFLDYTHTSYKGHNCGLLPLAGETALTTEGFKWDVIDWPSSLKGSVSSSNRFVGETGAIVHADNDLIVNIEM